MAPRSSRLPEMSLHKWGMFSVDCGLIHYAGVDPFHTHEGVSEWRAVVKEVQQSVKIIPDHSWSPGGFMLSDWRSVKITMTMMIRIIRIIRIQIIRMVSFWGSFYFLDIFIITMIQKCEGYYTSFILLFIDSGIGSMMLYIYLDSIFI